MPKVCSQSIPVGGDMVALKHSEKQVIEAAFEMRSGYVLDFTNHSMEMFFMDEFGIAIYSDKYSVHGSSKARLLRTFIAIEDGRTVAAVLRRLWEYRETVESYTIMAAHDGIRVRLFQILDRIEKDSAHPRTDALYRFKEDETLDELIAAIERDVGANKPGAVLDRLHTYCMKKFGHLLDQRGIPVEKLEPLHSKVGKYVKALNNERALSDVTAQIVKNSIGVFEKFNHVRNQQSLAHDNEIMGQAEARFVYDSITALLRFVRSVEADKFGA